MTPFWKQHSKLFLWGILFILTSGLVRNFPTKQGNLVINEFVTDNKDGLVDEDGDYSDWIEIYNPGNQAINLAGWSLTDDSSQPDKWPFPDRTIGSGEYLILFASGKNRSGDTLHTNFRLSKTGEFLGLYNLFQDKFMDQISQYPVQFPAMAYGRYKQSDLLERFSYLAHPTPGQANDENSAWYRIEFSRKHGFYEQPFTLELSTIIPNRTIRYTTDGSLPTEINGQTYTKPILIDKTTILRAVAIESNFLPTYIDTRTYIFLDDILAQPDNPPGFPSTWGTHGDNYGGYIPGSQVVADYAMDQRMVKDKPALKESLQSIPILSIAIDIQSFVDLYANSKKRGIVWERPVSVELFNPQEDQSGFQINAGLRMHGNAGRAENMPKHSFRLFFRGQYGSTKLEYPLFPNSPVEKFDTLVLRAGSDRSYAGWTESGYDDFRPTTYTRDEWMRASQIEMSGIGSHGIFVHLYLNGLYWGLYNITERPDASFMSAYLGGEKDNWYIRNHSGTVSGSEERIESLLHELVDAGGLDNMTGPARYALLKQYVDTIDFIDYIILNWYAGTGDWPSNNWYASVQNPYGQVRLFVWDAEHTWDVGARIYLGKPKHKNLVRFFSDALLPSADFRMELADRFYKHLFNDGLLTDTAAQARWLRLNSRVESAIMAESARWGDVRSDNPITPQDWLKARDNVLTQMEGNATKLISLAREMDFYPPIDPPIFNQHGGLIEPNFELNMTAPTGNIYFTVDGSDPRLWEIGELSPEAMLYNTPLLLTQTTHVKARLWVDGTWSALAEATFKFRQSNHQLCITEIMYNPIGGDDYEFIELKNISDTSLNLANFSLEDGIRFSFLSNRKPLVPSETIVLVHNQEAFTKRYPSVSIGGEYAGRLSNKGETITIKDATKQIIASVTYDDENGWPLTADGQGDSLVLIDVKSEPNDPHNWRASLNLGGTLVDYSLGND